MRSLMAQSKNLFVGVDAMDLFAASLNQRPSALLEFVCEALWHVTATFMGDDGSAATNEQNDLSATEYTHLVHKGAGIGSTSIGSTDFTASSLFASNDCIDHFSTSSSSVGTWLGDGGSVRVGSSYSTPDSQGITNAAHDAASSAFLATRCARRTSSNITTAQSVQHAVGSRWDLGRKALRAMISTGFLEVDDPGGGPIFRSVLMAPIDTMREAVRRLLPYTAILLGELERPSEPRKETIAKRVVSSLACFVVVIDAHLRGKCGLPAEVDAVVAEATAARVAEFCGLMSR